MTVSDFFVILPQISMACIALGILIADIFLKNKLTLLYLCVGLLLIPLILSIAMWLEWLDVNLTGFFGTVTADRFALFFQILIVGITLSVIVASIGYMNRLKNYEGETLALILFAATGMMLLASARELVTAYISFELAALPFVGLTVLRRDALSVEAALKFLILSAIGSAFLLMGIVFIYGYSGSTFFENIFTAGNYSGILVGITIIVTGLAFKMSIAPWHMWVPDVYQGAPTPVSAYLSTASKAAAFAFLIRLLWNFQATATFSNWYLVFAVLAVLSMTYGNLGALKQSNIKRLLGYSTIAQAGYMFIGIATLSYGGYESLGAQATMYYIFGYAFTNLAVFFATMAITDRTGSNLIESFAGMAKRYPIIAGLMTAGLLSLIGIPPTVGFIAKVSVFGAAINAQILWLAIVGGINSVISAYYYLAIIGKLFFAEPKYATDTARFGYSIVLTTAAAAVGTILLGILPFLLFTFVERSLPLT